ncbi:MAG: hypothetical protein KAS30_05200, partial [Candidatus Diapherotrites archaeon]|nr:hypothetical protein [Candidatus Diapherotrites archaeon]
MAIKRTQRDKKIKSPKKTAGNSTSGPSKQSAAQKTLSILKKRALNASRQAVVEDLGPDRLIIESIAIYEDLDSTINLFATRLRDWYSVHFPEASRIFKENHEFTEFVDQTGDRKKITAKKLFSIGLSDKKVESIEKVMENTIGIEISKQDMTEIQKFAKTVLSLEEQRDVILDYLGVKMNEVAPNINSLVGETVGAKLLAKAGSLKKLALMPSSTIQVIGAEKALFRHLKNKSIRPPKHGIIY